MSPPFGCIRRHIAPFAAAGESATRSRASRILLIAYVAAGLTACAAAALYRADPLGAVRECALETLAANGVLVLPVRGRGDGTGGGAPDLARSAWWIAGAMAAILIFAASLGRGL